MEDWLDRTALLIGQLQLEQIKKATIAIVGLGGVGGACAEAICRTGVENLILIDNDVIEVTNINRQLLATTKTLGMKKVEAALFRMESINPKSKITALDIFYNTQTSSQLFSLNPDFVVDAIDTVSSKLILIEECQKHNVPIISCMGTGNRIDPTMFKIGDIADTAGNGCGLSRVMRHELKKRGINKLDVLYSTVPPESNAVSDVQNGRHSPASISFCPPVAGYIIASHVIKSILSNKKDNTTLK
ncbi:MAG: tRNA threonylcarbamoyladenosine dehydratase [Oscillospiraceae bacterium]